MSDRVRETAPQGCNQALTGGTQNFKLTSLSCSSAWVKTHCLYRHFCHHLTRQNKNKSSRQWQPFASSLNQFSCLKVTELNFAILQQRDKTVPMLGRPYHTPAGVEEGPFHMEFTFLKSRLPYNHPQLEEYKDEFLSTRKFSLTAQDFWIREK